MSGLGVGELVLGVRVQELLFGLGVFGLGFGFLEGCRSRGSEFGQSLSKAARLTVETPYRHHIGLGSG